MNSIFKKYKNLFLLATIFASIFFSFIFNAKTTYAQAPNVYTWSTLTHQAGTSSEDLAGDLAADAGGVPNPAYVGFQYGLASTFPTGSISFYLPSTLSLGHYDSVVSGITCGVDYAYRAIGYRGAESMISTTFYFSIPCPVAPSVTTTTGATSIGLSSATISASVNSGDYPVDTVGFTYTGGSTSTTVSYAAGTTHTFSASLNSFFCGTTYTFTPFVFSSGTTYNGTSSTFTTTVCPSPASVSTLASTSVRNTTVTLNGNLTSLGGNPSVSLVGFQYGTTISYGSVFSNSGSFTLGNFSKNVTGLLCNTTYHYRSFAQSSSVHGSDMTFTTTSCPTVTTVSASSIGESSATFNGSFSALTNSDPITTVGFQYGLTTTYGSVATNPGLFYSGNFSKNVTSLSCGTTYHYRAFVNSLAYGSDKTFTTGVCTGGMGNVSGYAWSTTTGWISLNCSQGSSSGTSICGTTPYSVNVTPVISISSTPIGLFSGYAWSSGVGWISFNSADVSTCGVGVSGALNPGSQAIVDLSSSTTKGNITGWARAIGGTSDSGWDGCISMRGTVAGSSTTYGVYYNATSTTSNLASSTTGVPSIAWGGPLMGWIKFPTANLSLATSTLVLTVDNGTTESLSSSGGTVNLSWTTSNLTPANCTASGDWSGPVLSGGGTRSINIDPNTTTSIITKTFSITSCTSVSGLPVPTGFATVTVTVAPATSTPYVSFKANGTGDTTPLVIASGSPITLEWQVTNVVGGTCTGTSSASFSGWAGDAKAPLSGIASSTTPVTYTEDIFPYATSTRAYTLTCGTVSKTVNITIIPAVTDTTPNISFTVNGATSTELDSSGGNVNLDWETTNLDSSDCTASSSDLSSTWTGFKSYQGGYSTVSVPNNTTGTTTKSYTYSLSNCLNGGVIIPPVYTTVNVAAGTGTTPDLISFTANGVQDTIIDAGNSVNLAWEVRNISLNGCTGTSSGSYTGWAGGSKIPSSVGTTATSFSEIIGGDGSIVSSTQVRTYTLSCGSAGSKSVTISVNPPSTSSINLKVNNDSPIVNLSPSTTSAVLTWDTTGLDSSDCDADSSDGDWTGHVSSYGGTKNISITPNTGTSTITKTYTISNCKAGGIIQQPKMVTVAIAPGSGSTVPELISFTASSSSFSGDSITVTSADSVMLAWQIRNIAGGSCRGTSSGSYTGWNSDLETPTSGLASTIATTYTSNIGTATTARAYTITCGNLYKTVTVYVDDTTGGGGSGGGGGGCDGVCPRGSAYVNLTANGDPSVSLPSAGGSVNMIWTTSNLSQATCNATGSWSGTKSSSGGSQSVTVSSNASTLVAVPKIYTIQDCTNASTGETVSPSSVTVTVAPSGTPNLISFTINGTDSVTVDPGESPVLSWQTQSIAANSCYGTSDGVSAPFVGSGWNGDIKLPSTLTTTVQTYYSYPGPINSSRSYTLDCGTAGSKTVSINVNPVIKKHEPCVGFSCVQIITTPKLKGIMAPWLEI